MYQPQNKDFDGTSPKYLGIDNLGGDFFFVIWMKYIRIGIGNALGAHSTSSANFALQSSRNIARIDAHSH